MRCTWSARGQRGTGRCWGKVKTEDLSNEIEAIPKLLEVRELKGCIVTIDAMGCQAAVAAQIVEQKGDYALAVKGNQAELYADIQEFFATARAASFRGVKHDFHATVEKGHGRLEVRRYRATRALAWLKGHWAGGSGAAHWHARQP